jgi:GNAT superfamily N-acetyltransferase
VGLRHHQVVAKIRVEATDDPRTALEQVHHLLSLRPVDNNILLSLLHQRVAHPEPGRYWTVLRDEEPVGFGLQSPPTFSAGLSPMDRDAVSALATAVAGEGAARLPGIIAEAGTAASFAGRWSELVADRVTPVEGQRMYRLGVLTPATGVPGTLRRATDADGDLLVAWRRSFIVDTGTEGIGDPATSVQHDLDDGRLFLWDDNGPCCSARASIPTAGVSRIGIVYSPPERRRRRYASACVGSLCAWVQEREHADCMLFTQLANPTSNGVYRRLGFEAVAEMLQYRFDPAP